MALTVVGLAFTSILAGRWWPLVGGAGCVLLVSGVVAYLLEKTNGRPIFPKARPQEATLPSSMDALKEIPADPKGADLASPKKTFTRQESERQTTIRLVNGPHERGCYGCLTLFALYACIGPFVAQTDFVKSHGSPDLITVVLLALVAAGFSHWFLQWRRMPRPDPDQDEPDFQDILFAVLLTGILFHAWMLVIMLLSICNMGSPVVAHATVAVFLAATISRLFRTNNRHAKAAKTVAAALVFPGFLLLGVLPLLAVDPKTYPENNPTPVLALVAQTGALVPQVARARLIRRRKREAALFPAAQNSESRKIRRPQL